MTKADLLRKLESVPMNAPVVFYDRDTEQTGDPEHTPRYAYTVTGRDGLCLILTETPLQWSDGYDDAEEVVR
jgi:hypothetical protein